MIVRENIQNFKREIDPKQSLGVGIYANPILLIGLENEYNDKGRLDKEHNPYREEDNTWNESIDSDEVHDILDNWENEADGYLSGWIVENEGDADYEWIHAQDLEGEAIKFENQIYYIPKTNIFKEISDIDENLNFERWKGPKSSINHEKYFK